jgi:hypothetical protein
MHRPLRTWMALQSREVNAESTGLILQDSRGARVSNPPLLTERLRVRNLLVGAKRVSTASSPRFWLTHRHALARK